MHTDDLQDNPNLNDPVCTLTRREQTTLKQLVLTDTMILSASIKHTPQKKFEITVEINIQSMDTARYEIVDNYDDDCAAT